MPTDLELLPVDPEPGPLHPRLIALVGVGGAFGSVARYGVTQWLPATAGFPWATFLVNLVGALVLGVLLELLTRDDRPDSGRRRQLRLLIGTGFCGGLTTYSTLAVEADLLIRSHRDGLALTYAICSVAAGIAVAAMGIALAARAGEAGHVIAVWVALAGGGGAMTRYVVDSWTRERLATAFPVGTLVINVSGSLLLGVLTGLVIAHGAATDLRTIAGTGFCGGYTTFSAASVESIRLAQQRRWAGFAAYTVGSLLLAIGAAGLGLWITGA